jgi:NAD(P)-dependent dehydrogenase (short-subunit alcohol dehydrogenase family)
MPGRFEGKVAIVTGAGSGYGQGIATKLSQEGATVVIVDLSQENGTKVAAELTNATFILADITKRTSWEYVRDTTVAKFGHMDIVVNNAGVCYDKQDTETVAEGTYDLMMAVNLKPIYHSATVIIPLLLKQDTPAVFVNVASTSAMRPRPGTTWYNASKAAVVAATSTMAIEYASRKIRFNTVCPVVGRTSMSVFQLVVFFQIRTLISSTL